MKKKDEKIITKRFTFPQWQSHGGRWVVCVDRERRLLEAIQCRFRLNEEEKIDWQFKNEYDHYLNSMNWDGILEKSYC